MSVTTIVFLWLFILTALVIVLSGACLYLYKTVEGARLEGMALRARLNGMSERGNRVRATARNHTIPPPQKVEIDLSQFEVIDDMEAT